MDTVGVEEIKVLVPDDAGLIRLVRNIDALSEDGSTNYTAYLRRESETYLSFYLGAAPTCEELVLGNFPQSVFGCDEASAQTVREVASQFVQADNVYEDSNDPQHVKVDAPDPLDPIERDDARRMGTLLARRANCLNRTRCKDGSEKVSRFNCP